MKTPCVSNYKSEHKWKTLLVKLTEIIIKPGATNPMPYILFLVSVMKKIIIIFRVISHSLQQQFWMSTPVIEFLGVFEWSASSNPKIFSSIPTISFTISSMENFRATIIHVSTDFSEGGSIADSAHSRISLSYKYLASVFANCLLLCGKR